jgi:hypothetical protein
MSNKARVEAFRARWRKGADPSETDMTDIWHYIDELEVALNQQNHVVQFEEDSFAMEHPIECREFGLLNCEVDHALRQLPGIPDGLEVGRYGVDVDEYGELVFEELNQGENQ